MSLTLFFDCLTASYIGSILTTLLWPSLWLPPPLDCSTGLSLLNVFIDPLSFRVLCFGFIFVC